MADNSAQALAEIAFRLQAWLDSMHWYNEKQYGKGKMLELRNFAYTQVLECYQSRGACCLEFFVEPKKEWWFDKKLDYIDSIVINDPTLNNTRKFAINGVLGRAVYFTKPATGILILGRTTN